MVFCFLTHGINPLVINPYCLNIYSPAIEISPNPPLVSYFILSNADEIILGNDDSGLLGNVYETPLNQFYILANTGEIILGNDDSGLLGNSFEDELTEYYLLGNDGSTILASDEVTFLIDGDNYIGIGGDEILGVLVTDVQILTNSYN